MRFNNLFKDNLKNKSQVHRFQMINEFFSWTMLSFKGQCFKPDEESTYREVSNKIVYCVTKLTKLLVTWFLSIANNWVFSA